MLVHAFDHAPVAPSDADLVELIQEPRFEYRREGFAGVHETDVRGLLGSRPQSYCFGQRVYVVEGA